MDNYSAWEAHELHMERLASDRPYCVDCDNPIYDNHYYYVEGEALCEDCMIDRYRRWTEDYGE